VAEGQLSIIRDTPSPVPGIPPGHLELVPLRGRRLGGWPRRLLLFFVCLWLVDASISLLIHHTGLQKKFTAHLAAAFGRPVDVGRYNFSLWTGPVLEAQSVTVGEDPRFGNEYFLRAESLTVRLRWRSLLRGHLELGTLSLSQPSLNVVRSSEGDWNLAEWLPRPNRRFAGGPAVSSAALRFQRIEVSGGRVNFKRRNEKLPFALVGVDGVVEPDGSGRWLMDLAATPWRVSTLTQQAGQIHIAGHVGGTSSRLLPAMLDLSWTDASISDALRLARGDDFGVRGNLAVVVSAQTTTGEWKVKTRAEMRQIHRWNLALRTDNPDLNLIAEVKWNPETSNVELTSATLEAPHSNARILGRLLWEDAPTDATKNDTRNPPEVKADSPLPIRVEISNSMVDLRDALAWLRAFHDGVSDRMAIQGTASMAGAFSGWPPRIENLSLSSDGADLTGLSPSLQTSVHVGQVDFQYDPDRFSLSPLTVSLGPRKASPTGTFRIETSFKPASKRPPVVHLAGSTANVGDMISAAGALGWDFPRGWDLAGALRCDLRWQSTEPWRVQPLGFIEIGESGETAGALLRAPDLNQAIDQLRARVEIRPGTRHVQLSSAQAFGAHWTGTLDRRDPNRGWQFVLSADHLATADLDRWLNPRWRETLIDRVLPFLSSHSPVSTAPETLQASGHLTVDELALAPYELHNLQGGIDLNGRHLEMADASAQFYGGHVALSLVADLKAVPSYRASVNFSGIDVAAMTAASTQLGDLFAGSASGDVSFLTHGATRADLIASLECDGSATLRDAEYDTIDLESSLRDAMTRPGASDFQHAAVKFACKDSKIQFKEVLLSAPGGATEAAGAVDFNRNLNFRLWVPADAGPSLAADVASAPEIPSISYQLSGTLSSPQITRISPSSRRSR
jgi:hypothetical protein